MARILAISSQVARGHVGLSAIVPVLQAMGHDVIALPTIVLSNHPGHPHFAGERIDPDLLCRMLDALDANGWLSGIDAVLTGYLPSAGHVAFAANAVTLLRARNPHLIYLCDPVLGDEPKGIYVAAEAAAAIRGQLLPLADILKMNRFECAWLADRNVATPDDVSRIVSTSGWPETLVTSLLAPDGDLLVNALVHSTERRLSEIAVRKQQKVPNGTGDAMAALYLGHRVHTPTSPCAAFERTVASQDRIIAVSAGHDELRLVPCLGELAA